MPGHNEQATATVSPHLYGDEYYFAWPGQLNKFSEYKEERDVARAEAIAEAVHLQPWDRVLDFGCGVGAMTAAFHAAEFPVVGVDFSPRAIAHTIPEARGLTNLLDNKLSLADIPNDMARLVIAKDVFEHLDESEIHEIVDELTCIGRQVLAVIPTTDAKGNFIFPPYNKDETHVTRLTPELWRGRFSYDDIRELDEVTELMYSQDKIPGTTCLLLEETNPKLREARMNERVRRARARLPLWRRVIGLADRDFKVDFDDLRSKR